MQVLYIGVILDTVYVYYIYILYQTALQCIGSHYYRRYITMGTDGFSVADENQIMKGSARELKW